MTRFILYVVLLVAGAGAVYTLGWFTGGFPYLASLLLLWYSGKIEKYYARVEKEYAELVRGLGTKMSLFREATEVLLRDNNLSWESRSYIDKALKDTKSMDVKIRNRVSPKTFQKILTVKAEEQTENLNDILVGLATKKDTKDAMHSVQQDADQAGPDKE